MKPEEIKIFKGNILEDGSLEKLEQQYAEWMRQNIAGMTIRDRMQSITPHYDLIITVVYIK